jgi:glycosyltransferase involved in cell wall biosynthesis
MMVQMGARRNYVYASQLEEAGLLHSLVTDAAWPTSEYPGRLHEIVARIRPALNGKIARRLVPNVPGKRIFASVLPTFALGLKALMHPERAYVIADYFLALRNRFRDFSGVKVMINYHGNGGPLIEHAKRRGAKIVTDFIITPRYLEIENEERRRWQGWEEGQTSQAVIDLYLGRMAKLLKLSDIYLCPSATVARDLATLPGFDAAKLRLQPYGISGVQLSPAKPVEGRIVFVGEAGLRKGIPYLAEAATILRHTLPECEVWVAGHAAPSVRNRPETSNLHFTGALNRNQMSEFYASADVFCLPSLAEGSATSAFEAMANGLPIVTTPSSGTMVEHGVDGLLVAERDGRALAQAIADIVKDRSKRAAFSHASYKAAQRYSDEICGASFVQTISELLDSLPPSSAEATR